MNRSDILLILVSISVICAGIFIAVFFLNHQQEQTLSEIATVLSEPSPTFVPTEAASQQSSLSTIVLKEVIYTPDENIFFTRGSVPDHMQAVVVEYVLGETIEGITSVQTYHDGFYAEENGEFVWLLEIPKEVDIGDFYFRQGNVNTYAQYDFRTNTQLR